jgi:hypothetical protein
LPEEPKGKIGNSDYKINLAHYPLLRFRITIAKSSKVENDDFVSCEFQRVSLKISLNQLLLPSQKNNDDILAMY